MCGAQLFLGGELVVAGLPEPDLAAGQRILSGVDLGTPSRSAVALCDRKEVLGMAAPYTVPPTSVPERSTIDTGI
jgi:hypothetical protein